MMNEMHERWFCSESWRAKNHGGARDRRCKRGARPQKIKPIQWQRDPETVLKQLFSSVKEISSRCFMSQSGQSVRS